MRTAAIAIIFVLFIATAQAKIYRWVDKNGSVHFSDKPYSEDAQEIKINETGIELDEASVDEEQEQSATTTPVAEKSLQQPVIKDNTTRKDPVKEEQPEDKIITEDDYKISTTIGKLGADLISISGRIGSGPKCYDMSVIATASNDSGLNAKIKDQVRKSNSFGSVTFKGTAKATGSAEDRGFWKVDSVEIRCNDTE